MIDETLHISNLEGPALYMAMDLAKKSWAVALTDRSSKKPTNTSVDAYNWPQLELAIKRAKARFGLGEDAVVVCCQEAGRDGFGVHHFLERYGILSVVVDPASIETSRKKRKAKTDRIDAKKLVQKLRSFVSGDEDVFSICRVPPEDAEDARRLVRERIRLVTERTQHRNRISALLALVGIAMTVDSHLPTLLKEARTSSGKRIGRCLHRELLRELERLELVQEQIKEVMAEMQDAIDNPKTEADMQAASLIGYKGVGLITALTLAREFFGWREFKNRKQVGAAAGLAPTPSQTGQSLDAELGISKAGNRRVRTLMIEISWGWLRYQPGDRNTLWYHQRLADGTKRSKRKLIVAVARRLLVDFWRHVTHGEIPDGTRYNVA